MKGFKWWRCGIKPCATQGFRQFAPSGQEALAEHYSTYHAEPPRCQVCSAVATVSVWGWLTCADHTHEAMQERAS